MSSHALLSALTKSFGSLFVTGWVFQCLKWAPNALLATTQVTFSGTIKWAVVGMVIGSSDATLFGMYFLCSSVCYHCTQKGGSLSHPNSLSQPADIFFLAGVEVRMPAALDVAVVSTLQSLMLDRAASIPGYALTFGKERKLAAHPEHCCSVGDCFLSLRPGGRGCSDRTLDVLSSIGLQLSQRLGLPIVDTVRHLFQHVAVALWRGNAALWIQ